MVTVTVEKKGAEYIRFEASGHAGFRKAGKDIVCAAVSALVINTVNSLEKFTEDRPDVVSEDGYVRMSFHGPLSERGQLLMDSLLSGLTETENSAGSRYLQVRIREVK